MADNTITATGPQHYGPPGSAAMLAHNRRVLLATILDRIAHIDPSPQPIDACQDCGSFACEHTAVALTQAYAERYILVFHAMHMATLIGYPAGIGFDPSEGTGWPVCYIELPTGQVSWHMPAHPERYDGHSTEDKYRRIAVYGGQARS